MDVCVVTFQPKNFFNQHFFQPKFLFSRTRRWADRDEIMSYWLNLVRKYSLRECAQFHCAVRETRWDDTEKLWRSTVQDTQSGQTRVIVTNYVVACCGQLSEPRMPDIDGLTTDKSDSFRGPVFHTA